MLAYSIMLLIIMIFTCLHDYGGRILSNDRTRKLSIDIQNIAFTLACLPAIIISSIRFEIGTDYTEVYWLGYLGVVKNPENPLIARSYALICLLLNQLSRSPVLFFCLSSCLIIFSVFWYIKQTNEKITLPVLFFFAAGLFFDSLNVVRQYMAIAVWLFSVPFMHRHRIVPYLLISTLSVLIHPSAILLVPTYFLSKVKLTLRRFITFGFGLFVCCVLACLAFPKVLIYVPKYSIYANWEPNPEMAGTVFAVIITMAVVVLFERVSRDSQTSYLLWSLLEYDGVVFMSYFIPQMGRVMIYFEIPVFSNLVPKLLTALPRPKKIIATCSTIIFLVCSTFYMNYYLGHDDVFPYRTIFEVTNIEDYLGEPEAVLNLFRQDTTTENQGNFSRF